MSGEERKKVSSIFLEYAQKAELFDYGPFKGSIVIRPYAYSMWEKFQAYLDAEIKRMDCDNLYFPCLIPERLLSMEKEHVEGFSPELAMVTHGGGEELVEKLAVRPTSETLMYYYFSKWISSWRDLPLKVNQWSNVVRWELRPFPFLRTSEFLWQEGHNCRPNYISSTLEMWNILNLYHDRYKSLLAFPMISSGKKASEKFPAALYFDR